jgi:hypothetical protein
MTSCSPTAHKNLSARAVYLMQSTRRINTMDSPLKSVCKYFYKRRLLNLKQEIWMSRELLPFLLYFLFNSGLAMDKVLNVCWRSYGNVDDSNNRRLPLVKAPDDQVAIKVGTSMCCTGTSRLELFMKRKHSLMIL